MFFLVVFTDQVVGLGEKDKKIAISVPKTLTDVISATALVSVGGCE